MEAAEEKSDGQTLEYVNLILAIILAALATPVVKWLVVHGGKLGIANPNAISFCNILFVGNICSGLVVLATFGWGGALAPAKKVRCENQPAAHQQYTHWNCRCSHLVIHSIGNNHGH